jgi:hypothetical protein
MLRFLRVTLIEIDAQSLEEDYNKLTREAAKGAIRFLLYAVLNYCIKYWYKRSLF